MNPIKAGFLYLLSNEAKLNNNISQEKQGFQIPFPFYPASPVFNATAPSFHFLLFRELFPYLATQKCTYHPIFCARHGPHPFWWIPDQTISRHPSKMAPLQTRYGNKNKTRCCPSSFYLKGGTCCDAEEAASLWRSGMWSWQLRLQATQFYIHPNGTPNNGLARAERCVFFRVFPWLGMEIESIFLRKRWPTTCASLLPLFLSSPFLPPF